MLKSLFTIHGVVSAYKYTNPMAEGGCLPLQIKEVKMLPRFRAKFVSKALKSRIYVLKKVHEYVHVFEYLHIYIQFCLLDKDSSHLIDQYSFCLAYLCFIKNLRTPIAKLIVYTDIFFDHMENT